MFSASEHAAQALTNFLSLGIPPSVLYKTEADKSTVVGYAVVYSSGKYHLPVLLPFTGKTTKDGTAIKSFTDFIRTDKDIIGLKCSEEQRLLNEACIEMYKTIQALPSTILSNPDALPEFVALFYLWQKAYPLIMKEQFVYCL